jgi:hypothetical protein
MLFLHPPTHTGTPFAVDPFSLIRKALSGGYACLLRLSVRPGASKDRRLWPGTLLQGAAAPSLRQRGSGDDMGVCRIRYDTMRYDTIRYDTLL